MNECAIRLITSGRAGLEVIWVDDMFRPDATVQKPQGFTEVDMLFDLSWLEYYRTNLRANSVKLRDAMMHPSVKRLNRLYEVCQECDVNLTCVNFEWAEQHINVSILDGKALLIDIMNLFAPVEHTRQEDRHFYGTDFAKRKRLGLGDRKWRYWTSAINEVTTQYPHDEAAVEDQSFSASTSKEKLTKWIRSLVFHVHDDDLINEAVEFYSRPWREVAWPTPYWGHDTLNKEENPYSTLISQWLKLTNIDTESTKCLGMFSGNDVPWNLDDHGGLEISSRRIRSDVLAAVLKKLEIKVFPDLPTGENWYLPISPALPFLTSLRAFVLAASAHGGRPVTICLRRHNAPDLDLFSLGIRFERTHKEEPARRFGLIEKHMAQKEAQIFHGAASAYDDLLYCRTGGLLIDDATTGTGWTLPFSGKGMPFPCVGTIVGHWGVTLCWAGQPKS